ncbi:MAG TPA: outer membrane lipoprotein carrier protein LolA [Xanthomonadales bacterium]|nr:outer membrane lipoprotein carrier protein LolA [Xanthomonadales bacterium]
MFEPSPSVRYRAGVASIGAEPVGAFALWLILQAALALLPMSASAQTASDRLAQVTAGLNVLVGRFEQRVHDADGRLSEQSSGTLALAAPRRFRWQYQTPFEQLILADGDRVWIYDPDLEQASVRQQGLEEQDNPLLALVDRHELQRQFTVADAGRRDDLDWIVLTPRVSDSARIESAWLGLSGADLVRMELRDALGQRTEIVFSDWQRNPDLPADSFRFVPPPGVDVVGEMGEDAEVFPVQ